MSVQKKAVFHTGFPTFRHQRNFGEKIAAREEKTQCATLSIGTLRKTLCRGNFRIGKRMKRNIAMSCGRSGKPQFSECHIVQAQLQA